MILDLELRSLYAHTTVVMLLQKDSRWIIQKYIERPLLIHHTKFDIRQWILIDSWSPLKTWVYKDSYLRFSSRKYSLDNFNSAIHLTNYAIQKNYDSKAVDISKELPDDNMWVNQQFNKRFLNKYGIENIWEDQVWPQMVEVLHKLLLCTQQSGCTEAGTKLRGFFELYGVDFMLSIDDSNLTENDNDDEEGEIENENANQPICPLIKVWIIEVNSCPSMALGSSKATHELCRSVMEDTIDLALHENRFWNNSPGAQVGKFVLAICNNVSQIIPKYTGKDLVIEGTEIKKPRD